MRKMEKLKGFELPVPHKKPMTDGDDEAKEFSIFHQAYFLFKRQDLFMTQFALQHDYAATTFEPSGSSLISLFSKLRHAAAPTKPAMFEKRGRQITKKSSEIAQALSQALKEGKGMSKADYTKIHQMLFELYELIHEYNQECGMGVPKDWKYSERAKIVQAVREK